VAEGAGDAGARLGVKVHVGGPGPGGVVGGRQAEAGEEGHLGGGASFRGDDARVVGVGAVAIQVAAKLHGAQGEAQLHAQAFLVVRVGGGVLEARHAAVVGQVIGGHAGNAASVARVHGVVVGLEAQGPELPVQLDVVDPVGDGGVKVVLEVDAGGGTAGDEEALDAEVPQLQGAVHAQGGAVRVARSRGIRQGVVQGQGEALQGLEGGADAEVASSQRCCRARQFRAPQDHGDLRAQGKLGPLEGGHHALAGLRPGGVAACSRRGSR
jgi:hypothetical protein